MADDYCSPLEACNNLDGRLLIEQTLQGPPLAIGGDIGIGDLTARVAVRPYIRFRYAQSWIPKELCMGPIRSIIGLAPSETMTLETRQVEQTDFVRLVQEASERSEVVSTSGPAGLVDRGDGSGTGFRPTDFMCFPVMWADRFGSIWEIGGAIVGAVVGGPIGAGVGAWLGGAVGGWLGGDDSGGAGTGNDSTQNAVDQVLESVTRTQSERTLTETTSSRSSLFERTVQRTFANPYRDRALQLRFIPVFRHFDVVTVFYTFDFGLVATVHAPKFAGAALSARLGDFIQRQIPDPRITAAAAAELGAPAPIGAKGKVATSPLSAHLNANSEIYAKRYLKHLEARRDLMTLQAPLLGALTPTRAGADIGDIGRSLRWSQSRVQGHSIYTPFGTTDILMKALPGIPKDFPKFLDRLERFHVRRVERHRDVHLFAGTVIEPAPGECVLAHVP